MNIWYALDFETSDQNRYTCTIDRVCVLAFDINTGKVKDWFDTCFRAVDDPNPNPRQFRKVINYQKMIQVMSSPNSKVAHNAEYELYLMEERLGIPIRGRLHDTMLMTKHWRNDFPSYGLKSLAWWLFGDLYPPLTKLREWIHRHNLKGEDDIEFDMTQCPDKLVHAYCMHDVKMTAKIATMMWPHVKENYAYEQDTDVIRLNSEMEARGITADVEFYKEFIRLGGRRIHRNRKQAAAVLDVESGRSPTGQALRSHLQDRGETRETPTGLTKSDDAVLRDHKDSEAVRAVQRVRSDEKQVNTYAKNILAVADPETGIFHPGLRQSAAITRRWRASSFYGDNGLIVKGNVQNFPRGEGIRTGIVVPPGYGFVKFDLASIEARMGAHAMSVFLDFDKYCMAYRANDKFNIYLDVVERCTDHKNVTKKDDIYWAYKHACLGIQYGVGIKMFHHTLVDKFNMDYSYGHCEYIYQTIRSTCPEFAALQRAVSSIVQKDGKIMDDFGAVYYVPVKERYKGVNYYCQGCAGNVFKWWWVHLDPLLKDTEDYLFNVVHDEFDGAIKWDRGARKRVKVYCNVMRGLDLFELPLVAEASGLVHNWGKAG